MIWNLDTVVADDGGRHRRRAFASSSARRSMPSDARRRFRLDRQYGARSRIGFFLAHRRRQSPGLSTCTNCSWPSSSGLAAPSSASARMTLLQGGARPPHVRSEAADFSRSPTMRRMSAGVAPPVPQALRARCRSRSSTACARPALRPAGGGNRPARDSRAVPAAAAGSTVAANRSRPRTTWLTPCSGIVDDDRKMIAGRHVAAGQHDVAPLLRAAPRSFASRRKFRRELASMTAARPTRAERRRHVEPPGDRARLTRSRRRRSRADSSRSAPG